MENLEYFYLSREESRDMMEFLAKKRKIKTYKRKSSDELLQAIKENKDNEQQPKNKKRMDIKREKLKDLNHNFFRIESNEIKKNFYNIEKRKQFDSKRTNKYLDELDEKTLDLNKYYYDDYEYKGINSIRILFKQSIDKPNNYVIYKIIQKNSSYTTIHTIYFYN